MNIVIGVTGATGAIYAVRLMEMMYKMENIKIHLVMSRWAMETLRLETELDVEDVKKFCDVWYENENLAAAISSGSFQIDATVILPCSMKTLSAIANGYDDCLITRAADVAMKERRRLIVCPRETPLTAIHIENMLKLSRLGVDIIPPMVSFYHRPETIDDIVAHFCVRIIDHLGIDIQYEKRWQ